MHASSHQNWEKELSGRVGEGVTYKVGRSPVQTPLYAWLEFGTQPRYEAPGNLWVKTGIRNAVISKALVRICPWQWFKVGLGAVKADKKNWLSALINSVVLQVAQNDSLEYLQRVKSFSNTSFVFVFSTNHVSGFFHQQYLEKQLVDLTGILHTANH